MGSSGMSACGTLGSMREARVQMAFGDDSVSVGCRESDMALPVGNRIRRRTNPELRVSPGGAVAERRTDIQHHRITERLQDGIVERAGRSEVIHLDSEVIDHAATLSAITDSHNAPGVRSFTGARHGARRTPRWRRR